MSAPMDPERLADLRDELADDSGPWREHTIELLADRDRLAAEVDELMAEEADRLLILGAKLTSPATDAELIEADRDRLAAEVTRVNEMRGDDAETIERLEAERDEWTAAARLRMTTGFAFGFRAQLRGESRRTAAAPRAWLAGFDFAAEMFGGAADS